MQRPIMKSVSLKENRNITSGLNISREKVLLSCIHSSSTNEISEREKYTSQMENMSILIPEKNSTEIESIVFDLMRRKSRCI